MEREHEKKWRFQVEFYIKLWWFMARNSDLVHWLEFKANKREHCPSCGCYRTNDFFVDREFCRLDSQCPALFEHRKKIYGRDKAHELRIKDQK